MKKILYLIYILKIFIKTKKIYSTPKQKKLIIFDSYSSREHFRLIFDSNILFEIHCPGDRRKVEFIYLSFKIISLSIIELLKGNIASFYYIALIRAVNPKAVVTFIDNNFTFFELSKKLGKKYKFVVIQNSHTSLLEFSQKDLKKIYIPEYLCLNKFTVDHFNSLKVKVDKFNIVGSINLSLAENYLSNNQNNFNNDKRKYVCVIAGAMPEISSSLDKKILNQLRERQIKLWKYVTEFSRKHEIFFKLASRQTVNFSEDDFLKKRRYNFEDRVFKETNADNKYFVKIDRRRENFTSYELAFKSELVIGFHSTILLESLAKDKKILCISSLDSYSNAYLDPLMPEDNISSIYNPSFDEFEDRVLLLLKMSIEKYSEIMSFKKKYMTYYDKKKSTLDIIKNRITEITS